jgi:hypothetical protein
MEREQDTREISQRTADSASRPPLGLITQPPLDSTEREQIGVEVWTGLYFRFDGNLSEQERSMRRNPPKPGEKCDEYLHLAHAFDDFLLHQFAEFGWRMLMSVEVLQRLAEWEKHSPVLLARLGEELALRSKVLRGEKSAPLGIGIEKFADAAIVELGMLLSRQREEFGPKRGVVSCEKISAWMKAEIDARPAEFPQLRANLAQLCGFVASLPKRNPNAARILQNGGMRASGFFIQWYATCSNRSPKDLKNQLSRLRNQR